MQFHFCSLISLNKEMHWYEIVNTLNTTLVMICQIEGLTRFPSQAHTQVDKYLLLNKHLLSFLRFILLKMFYKQTDHCGYHMREM
jgi:hypothetical protein